MNTFESIVVGLLVLMLFGIFMIGKWVMVIMINSRLINKKIERHNTVDLELRFFRFLHFNGFDQKESSKYYLGKILKHFSSCNNIDDEEEKRYKVIYETFKNNRKS